MVGLFLSIGLVFLAELGDKSQLAAVAMVARYGRRTVLVGVALGTAALALASTLAGRLIADVIPTDLLTVLAGVAFLAFAVLTFFPENEELEPTREGRAVLAVAFTFAAAEMGDKTMFAIMALATQHPWWQVWIGATIGEVAAIGLAVVLGHALLRRVPPRIVEVGAALVFAAIGVLLLAEGLPKVV